MVENSVEGHDLNNAELDAGGSSVDTDRDLSRTPSTTVASSDTRTPLSSASKRVTEKENDDEAYSLRALDPRQSKGEYIIQPKHDRPCLTIENERDGGQDHMAHTTDVTGSGISERSHVDISSRSPGKRNSDREAASGSSSEKRKLPLLATGGSVESNPAPQYCRKRCRRLRFSAPVPSNRELDTGDETSGSVYMPRGSPCERGPSQPLRTPRWRHRLNPPRSQRLHLDSISHQDSPSGSVPSGHPSSGESGGSLRAAAMGGTNRQGKACEAGTGPPPQAVPHQLGTLVGGQRSPCRAGADRGLGCEEA